MRSAVRESLYRLSRDTHARAADQGASSGRAHTDKVLANLLSAVSDTSSCSIPSLIPS